MDEQTRKAMEAVLAAAVEFHETDTDADNGTTAKAEHWAKFRASLETYCLRRNLAGYRAEANEGGLGRG